MFLYQIFTFIHINDATKVIHINQYSLTNDCFIIIFVDSKNATEKIPRKVREQYDKTIIAFMFVICLDYAFCNGTVSHLYTYRSRYGQFYRADYRFA